MCWKQRKRKGGLRNTMKLKKILYVVLGCIGAGMGALGAVLPLLPAFPFLLLAALCFMIKSSRSSACSFRSAGFVHNFLPG